MKQQKSLPVPACRVRHLFTAVAATFSLFLSTPGSAQYNSQWYEFEAPTPLLYSGYPTYTDASLTAKAFSTEMVPGTTTMECVMAGTMYDSAAHIGRPMFLHYKKHGTGFYPDLQDAVVYEDPNSNYYDHRAIDIVPGSTANSRQVYYIVNAVREDLLSGTTVAPAKDKIKVMMVDATGAQTTRAITISDNFVNGSTVWGRSLYPTHAIFKPNVQDPNNANHKADILYICGFVTMDWTSCTLGTPALPPSFATVSTVPPNYPYPGFHTKKAAFVIALDVTNNTFGSIINAKYYDYILTGGSSNNPEFDFDIAMRLTELSSSHPMYPGDIHVTGSVNALTGASNGSSATFVRSATMNMIVDNWTLVINAGQHFIAQGNGDGYGTSEYGVGFVEKSYGTISDCYVIGNKYKGLPAGGAGGYTQWQWPGIHAGFNIEPDGVTLTHTTWLGATLSSPFALSQRALFDKGYAVQVLESKGDFQPPTSSTTVKTFLVAGMYHDGSTGFPAHSNYIPFLWDMTAVFSLPGNVSGTMAIPPTGVYQDNSFLNLTGTGDPATFSNNYLTEGTVGLQGMGWNPTFAARAGLAVGQDIALNAPKFSRDLAGNNPTRFFLGLKTMYVDGVSGSAPPYIHLDNSSCQAGYTPSTPTLEYIQPYDDEQVGNIELDLTLYGTPLSLSVDKEQYDEYGLISTALGDCNSGVYKHHTTGIGKTAGAAVTKVYPNPAKDVVTVELSGNIGQTDKIKVQLVNMQGQLIGRLYNGTAIGMHPMLQLPAVADGLYFVQVYANGVLVHTEKLAIQ